MGVVRPISAEDVATLVQELEPAGVAVHDAEPVDADTIDAIARARHSPRHWPAWLRTEYETEVAGRVIRDQHFLFLLGLLVCLATILIDAVVNPAMIEEGAILRVLAVAPITLLGLVAGAREWKTLTAFCVGASPIAFAVVIVHLSLHLPAETAARYLTAPALLLGFANLALPYSLRGLVVFDIAFIAATLVTGIASHPVDPLHHLDFVILELIIALGTIQLARRFEQLRQHNFLLTMRARTTSSELLQANRQLRDLSNRDALTGLANRRFFNRLFDEMVEERHCANMFGSQQDCRIAILMIDIDHFKSFNDTHGHQAGDEALRIVGHELASILECADGIAARYGGEEFIAAVCETGDDEVSRIAEDIRERIATRLVPVGRSGRSVITASIGVALTQLDATPQREDLIRVADEALYNAKRDGRNQVRVIPVERPDTEPDMAVHI